MTLSALLFPEAWQSRADRDMSIMGAAASISGVATTPGTPRPLWAPHVRLALPALQTVQPLLAAFSQMTRGMPRHQPSSPLAQRGPTLDILVSEQGPSVA
jgi:hypothetical protein